MTSDLRQRIREVFSRFFRGRPIPDGEDIFASGHVNSMALMELIGVVEQELGTAVQNDELELDNFRSIDAVVTFIQLKQGAG